MTTAPKLGQADPSSPDHLGPALLNRTTTVWISFGLAFICAVPLTVEVVAAATRPDDTGLGLGVAVALWAGLVALPWWLGWVTWAQRVHVNDEAVTTVGVRGRVRRMRWDELTEVVVGPEIIRTRFAKTHHDVVRLVAVDERGRRRGMRISGTFVKDLRPLVARLAAEVERRPELVAAARRADYVDVVGRWGSYG